jgi:TolA-binding protein
MSDPRVDWPQRWADAPTAVGDAAALRARLVRAARGREAPRGLADDVLWRRIVMGALPRPSRVGPVLRPILWSILLLSSGATAFGAYSAVRSLLRPVPTLAPRQAIPPRRAPIVQAGDEAPAPEGTPAPAVQPEGTPAPVPVQRAARPATTPGWRGLARQGRYDEAYRALPRLHAQPPRWDVESELAAADVARLSGHVDEAVVRLERILQERRADPRAAAAAFTLGRVHADERRDPRRAADAFALAFRLAPAGMLAPDALAREAVAWDRAGEPARARAAARRYLDRYPNGLAAGDLRALASK